jgi:iron(III) transport system substrate-binding protein
MRRAVLIVTVIAAAMFAGCGSPTSEGGGDQGGETGYEDVFAAIKGLQGKAKLDKLASLAEEEGGTLSLYTSLTSDVENAVTDAFEDAYDIDVSVYRADSETVLQRLTEEFNADFRGADAVETNGPELLNLGGEGVLVDYAPEALPDLVDGSDFDGWTADRFNKFVISWNTDLVPDGQQPKSWEELADPKWDGKLALELSDVEWYKTLFEYFVDQGMSEEEAQGLFEDMARGGRVVSGHTVIGELTAAGDIDVAASNYSYLVQQLTDAGAPVSWQPPVEPIISRANGVGLVKSSEHPAAAALFEEWILSPDGQQVLADSNLDVARQEMASTQGVKEIQVDLQDYVDNQQEWTDRYEELTRLGEEASG